MHGNAVDFFHFQVDVSVNLVIIKDAASCEEFTVAIKSLQSFAKRATNLRNFARFLSF